MEYAKKMVLIPRESIERLQQLQNIAEPLHSVQTPGDELSRLDNEMSKQLNAETLHDNEKWKHYQQTLLRFLRLTENARSSQMNIPTTSTPMVNESEDSKHANHLPLDSIVDSVPGKFRTKALLLLSALKNIPNDKLSWNEQGIVKINGEVLQGSNIIDLVNDSMRYRKNFASVGREQFATFLQESNIPKEYIGNKDFQSVIKKKDLPGRRSGVIILTFQVKTKKVFIVVQTVLRHRGSHFD